VVYELTWVDDPYGDRRTEVEAVIPAAFQPTTTEEVQMLPRIQHRAKEAVGGYLAIPNALMEALIHEMDAQEMFEENESAREKLEAQSGTLTVAELNEILSRVEWPPGPGDKLPELSTTNAFDERIAAHSLQTGDGYVAPTEAVLRLSPLGWAREWVRFIAFLDEGRNHGGVVIG